MWSNHTLIDGKWYSYSLRNSIDSEMGGWPSGFQMPSCSSRNRHVSHLQVTSSPGGAFSNWPGPKGVRHLLVLFVRFRVLLNLNPARYKDEALKNTGNQIILILLMVCSSRVLGCPGNFWLIILRLKKGKKRTYTKTNVTRLGDGAFAIKILQQNPFFPIFMDSWTIPYLHECTCCEDFQTTKLVWQVI